MDAQHQQPRPPEDLHEGYIPDRTETGGMAGWLNRAWRAQVEALRAQGIENPEEVLANRDVQARYSQPNVDDGSDANWYV